MRLRYRPRALQAGQPGLGLWLAGLQGQVGPGHRHLPVVSTAYWLARARVCYTVCAALFLLPFSILRTLSPAARTLKNRVAGPAACSDVRAGTAR